MAVEPKQIVGRLLGAALLSVATYYALWGGEYTAFDLRRIRVQQEVETQRLADTREEVDSLRSLAQRLDNDPSTIESIARERFGMIRDGEILYRFIDVESEDRPTP